MSFFPTFIVNAKITIYLRINNPFKKKGIMKYPIGIQSFDKMREDGFVYVDRTALIYKLICEYDIFSEPSPTFWKESAGEYPGYLFQGKERIF